MVAIEGYFEDKKEHTRLIRHLSWVTYCGYRDPKKGYNSIEAFWPMDGNSGKQYKAPSKKRLIEMDKVFRKLKLKLN